MKELKNLENIEDDLTGIKMGLPNEKTSATVKKHFLAPFITTGLALAFLLIVSGLALKTLRPILFVNAPNIYSEIFDFVFIISGSAIYSCLVSLGVGIIQVLRFRGQIKARQYVFLVISGLGGAFGGLTGGMLYYFFMEIINPNGSIYSGNPPFFNSFLWSLEGLIIGVVNGGIIGFSTSLLQNYLMNNSKYSLRWFIYNLLSWSCICSIGWALIMITEALIDFPFLGDAVASIFIMVTHGFSFILFLKYSPQIEFS